MTTIDVRASTTIRGPRKKDGYGTYEIRGTRDGTEILHKGFSAPIAAMSGNGAELFALSRAAKYVDRLIKANDGEEFRINIYTGSAYILSNWWYVKSWKAAGWKTAKGADIKNRELWQTIDELLQARSAELIKEG